MLEYSDLEIAQYELVHQYIDPKNPRRRGSEALAPRCGLNPGTLSNKVNPRVDTHRLALDEAIALQVAANSTRIIEAEATVLGGVFVRLGNFADCSDVELLTLYARFHAEVGTSAVTIKDALADDRITVDELQAIRGANRNVIQALLELESRLEALCDD